MTNRLMLLSLGTLLSFLCQAPPTQQSDPGSPQQEISPREQLRTELKSLEDEAGDFRKITLDSWLHHNNKPPASDESIRLICGQAKLDLGVQAASIVETLLQLHESAKCKDDKAAIEDEINKCISHYHSTIMGAASELEVVSTTLVKDSKEQQIATDAATRFRKLFHAIAKIRSFSFRNAKKFGQK